MTNSAPKPERERGLVVIYECPKHGPVGTSFQVAIDPEHNEYRNFCPYCLGEMLSTYMASMKVIGQFQMPVPASHDEIVSAADAAKHNEVDNSTS